MRIAFVGTGGSGETTATALVARYLARQGRRVVAIDADINQHLGAALGHDGPPPRALCADLPWLKDHQRGANPRVASADVMIKTTPPGRGCSTSTPPTPCWPAAPCASRAAPTCSSPARSPSPTSASRATTPRPVPWSSTPTTCSTARTSTSWST